MLKTILYFPQNIHLFLPLFVLSVVESHCISCPGGCSTDVTGVGDSGDVVGLYVVYYVVFLSLLATHFTDPCSALFSTFNNILTEHHHGLDLVIQILQVSSHSVVSDSYSSF